MCRKSQLLRDIFQLLTLYSHFAHYNLSQSSWSQDKVKTTWSIEKLSGKSLVTENISFTELGLDNEDIVSKCCWECSWHCSGGKVSIKISFWLVQESSCFTPLFTSDYVNYMFFTSYITFVFQKQKADSWFYPGFHIGMKYHDPSDSSVQSVQSLNRVRLLRSHELQHARPPCPSPIPGIQSNSRPSSQWCHPATSSSVIPFSDTL